jgi:hypothetical protein
MPDPGQARYGRLGTTRRERDPAGHHRVLACGLPPSVVRRSLAEVVAFALKSNLPSLAVMERLGFRRQAHLDLPAGPHWLYRKNLTRGTRGA